MRQQHTSSITQTHTSIPSPDEISDMQTCTTRPATRVQAIILRLAFGLGVVILLALLNAWLSPSTRATIRDSWFAGQTRIETSSEALEDIGMAPVLFDDFWARL